MSLFSVSASEDVVAAYKPVDDDMKVVVPERDENIEPNPRASLPIVEALALKSGEAAKLMPSIAPLRALHDPSVDNPTSSIPYLFSNEADQGPTIEFLMKEGAEKSSLRLHVGCSGWFNYDIMVARSSDYGIIMDIDHAMLVIHEMTARAAIAATSRQNFVDRIIAEFESDPDLVYGVRDEAWVASKSAEVRAELTRPGSWLATDEGFNHIKGLFMSGRLIPLAMSLLDVGRMSAIGAWEVNADTIYVSNVFEWQGGLDSKELFQKAVIAATVPASTIMIYAGRSKALSTEEPLTQKVSTVEAAKIMRKAEEVTPPRRKCPRRRPLHQEGVAVRPLLFG